MPEYRGESASIGVLLVRIKELFQYHFMLQLMIIIAALHGTARSQSHA